jgi:alpha-N-arabinofuranosidase
MNSMNTFDNPDGVKPIPFGAHSVANSEVKVNVPAKSVVVLELQ